MTNSHENNKNKVDKNDKEIEHEELGFIDPMDIADKIGAKHIAIEKADLDVLKKANARLNVHKHVRDFLIILVKIAQKHAAANPKSELAGVGMMLIPISKHIIGAIVEEVQKDPEDLIRLIEFFFHKLKKEGFFIGDEEEEKSSDNKNG